MDSLFSILGGAAAGAVIELFLARGMLDRGLPYVQEQLKRERPLALPSFPLPSNPFTFKRSTLINLQNEQDAIKHALESKQTRCLLLQGEGGIGKTRILEEVQTIVQQQKNKKNGLRWGGLYDLYHTSVHDAFYLRQEIAHHLENIQMGQHPKFFNDFFLTANEYEDAREKGVMGGGLEQLHQKMCEDFTTAYAAYSEQYRPVILFDTAENLQRETDVIQNLLSDNGQDSLFTPYQSPLLQWLTPENFPNTVLIIAGRPSNLHKHLQKRFIHPGSLEILPLAPFTQVHAQQFIRALLAQVKRDPDFPQAYWKMLNDEQAIAKIAEMGAGLPVRIAVLLELLLQYDLLTDETGQGQFDALLHRFFDHEREERRIFLYTAVARKGLDLESLDDLAREWSREQCDDNLDLLDNRTLVKTRQQYEQYFLHDELYQFFDDFHAADDPILLAISENLADYYHQQISIVENREEEREVRINRFYYELWRDPNHAFTSLYRHWINEAIDAVDREFDWRLRDEMLRFWQSDRNQHRAEQSGLTRKAIDQEHALLWVKRLIVMDNKYEEALTLCHLLLHANPDLYEKFALPMYDKWNNNDWTAQAASFFTDSDDLFWAQLLIYYGYALTHLGKTQPAETALLWSIASLEEQILTAPPRNIRFTHYLLGYAYNRLGFAYRTTGRFLPAQTYYKQAIVEFTQIGDTTDEAMVRNNLAFVLSLLGHSEAASLEVNRALDIRLQQKLPGYIGASYNTRGKIRALEQKSLTSAQRDCERANQYARKSDNQNGKALSLLAQGRISRHRGRKAQKGDFALYKQAENYLISAENLYTSQIEEPIRLWETQNELGSLYYEWAQLHNTDYYQQAIEYQYKALQTLEREREKPQKQESKEERDYRKIDTLDDLAGTYMSQQNLKAAKAKLDDALNYLPDSYQLVSTSRHDINYEAGNTYMQAAGKLYARLALWHFISSESTSHNPKQDTEKGISYLVASFHALYIYSIHPLPFLSGVRQNYQEIAKRFIIRNDEFFEQLETRNIPLQFYYQYTCANETTEKRNVVNKQ